MTTCKRCGKCCYLELDGVRKKCKYLIKVGNNSVCRIYNAPDRIGKFIGQIGITKFYCINREDTDNEYDGCPYNVL